jgi:hypothetical protein
VTHVVRAMSFKINWTVLVKHGRLAKVLMVKWIVKQVV